MCAPYTWTFLVGAALLAPPNPDLTDVSINRLNRWQLVQRLTQDFWKQWSREYLIRLQSRPKWLSKKQNMQAGDLVIIKDANLPPTKWRLGRVTKSYQGSDGVVRVVDLQTAAGSCTRPIHELCRLPVEDVVLKSDKPKAEQ